MKVYRGELEHPIVFPESTIITKENLDSIDFNKVVYCEVATTGAMGNAGGIILYLLKDERSLVTYEINIKLDKELFDTTSDLIKQHAGAFIYLSGGYGNSVLIKKDLKLEIDEKYKCFWYHSQSTKLRIDSSVHGVFNSLVARMKSINDDKSKEKKNNWNGN
jgi:hypothetical protein